MNPALRPLALLLALAGCTPTPPEATPPTPETPAPHPAGTDCAACHAAEAAAWAGSHHAQASGTDLHPERFDGVTRTFGDLRVTPALDETGAPVLRIRDGAGESVRKVTGTIGVEPLQQYLLADARGRVLVAPVAWDLAEGRWFDPAPDGVAADPADPLYWAGMAGNWNHLCGECHTTGYQKGYDPTTDTYTSTHAAPSVGCVACHGEGATVAALDRPEPQIRACTPCHSRHETLGYGTTPDSELLDTVRPALIGSVVFEADGRIHAPDEPFEWGAYSQSGMFKAGVRCSDCHDPHSGRTRGEGPAVCVRCHADVQAAHPDTPDTSDCIGCHMPTRTYMGIDRRHDHGMHGPGPTELGALWSAGLARDPAAAEPLLALALDPTRTSFVRASAVALLRGQPPTSPARLRDLLRSPDALLRVEVTETLAAWGDLPISALEDPAKAVRFSAFKAVILLGAPQALRTPAFERVRQEFEATPTTHGDLASTWQNLGGVRQVLGDAPGALGAYEEALRRDPGNTWLAGRVEALRGK